MGAVELTTRANSINRALDQIGDKWCLLIIQELLWGINAFNDMRSATGVSRGVLANRLKWLESVDCVRRDTGTCGSRRPRYHLTSKSLALYDCALMAINWERRWYNTPQLDQVALVHLGCGQAFTPEICCGGCNGELESADMRYLAGPGARRDVREKKVRRRSSVSIVEVPSSRTLYKQLINIVGDRWTSNIIGLAFTGLTRFDEFHKELPVATNILSDRLKFLVDQGVFEQRPYQLKPPRFEYHLTAKGEALYPWFVCLLKWGDTWCDPEGGGPPLLVEHRLCGQELQARVQCSECRTTLKAREVQFSVLTSR